VIVVNYLEYADGYQAEVFEENADGEEVLLFSSGVCADPDDAADEARRFLDERGR
jgi:hypothetical protein